MKRILTIVFVTVICASLVLAIIFVNHANKTYCLAIKLMVEHKSIESNINRYADDIAQIKSAMKIQPHTVVLLKPGEYEQWEIEDIKRFADGEEEEFIEFLKR